MSPTAPASPMDRVTGPLLRAEKWLDDRGKPAWIFAMVLGFIFVWPLGLALLIYMIWSGKMKSSCHRSANRSQFSSNLNHSSGNSAFDNYKADTLRRLEEEQAQFARFMQRLADAKDKAEFDQFMAEREARIKEDAAPST